MDEVNHLIAFRAISNFVKDLADEFSDKYHSLALYNRLLEKTTVNNDKIIQKHVSLFREFLIGNRNGIIENDLTKFTKNRVSYSDRVFIDVVDLYSHADKSTKQAIRKHLLTLSAILDPDAQAKKTLQTMSTPAPIKVEGDSKESEFINNLINKVETSVSTENMDNPMQAVSSILSSGLFNDLVSSMSDGINSGELNIGKLMGTMQTVMTSISGNAGQQNMGGMPDMASLLSTLSSIAPPK